MEVNGGDRHERTCVKIVVVVPWLLLLFKSVSVVYNKKREMFRKHLICSVSEYNFKK